MLNKWIQTNRGLMSPIEALQHASSIKLTSDGINFISQLRFLLGLLYSIKNNQVDVAKGEYHLEEISTRVSQNKLRFDTMLGWHTQPDLEGKTISSYSKLLGLAASGQNKTTYAYNGQFLRDDKPLSLSEAELCNAIWECQNFSLDFGMSALGSRHHSPLATAAIGIGIGESLAETLVYNYLDDPNNSTVRWLERQPTANDIKNQHENSAGYAARMTWIAQSLRFEGAGVYTARGLKLSGIGDPMVSTQAVVNGPNKGQIVNVGIDDQPYITATQINSPAFLHAVERGAQTMLLVAQRNDPNQPAKLLERFSTQIAINTLNPTLGAILKAIRGKINYFAGDETTSRAIIATICEHQDFGLDTLPGIIDETLQNMKQRRFSGTIQKTLDEFLGG